jgi:uncharacterized protein involved in propanediol utilization
MALRVLCRAGFQGQKICPATHPEMIQARISGEERLYGIGIGSFREEPWHDEPA